MPATATHAPGTFCWVELGADDGDAAKRFYTALFGWEAEDSRMGPGENDIYTIYKLNGEAAAASFPLGKQEREAGVPSTWRSYVAVDDADASAAKAKELGGTIVAGPFDAMDIGRMAVVQDPTGAVFMLWQAKRNPGVGVKNEPGSLTWNELATHDAGRARDFYAALFGWNPQTMEMGNGMEYTTFTGADGAWAGGMYGITPDMPPMPSNWMPYFAVADADASAARAKEIGGTVVMEPQDIPNVGRFAMIRDPQGAMFYVIRMNPM